MIFQILKNKRSHTLLIQNQFFWHVTPKSCQAQGQLVNIEDETRVKATVLVLLKLSLSITVSSGLSEVARIWMWHKKRPLSLRYSRNTRALPEILSRVPVCDFLCSEDGRCKQLPTSYQNYRAQSQRMQSIWEWINNAPSKPASVHSVPTFGPDKKTSLLRHESASSPVMFISSVWRAPSIREITQQPPQDVSYFDDWKVHAGSGGGSHWFIFTIFLWLTAI